MTASRPVSSPRARKEEVWLACKPKSCCYTSVVIPTGKDVWQGQIEKRPGGSAWGSMLHADGRLYITDRGGNTTVFAANPKYEVLAQNRLGEHTDASIAVSNGDLFIRTYKTLWCISEKK